MDESFDFSNLIGQLAVGGPPVALEASTVAGYCLTSVDDVGDEKTRSHYRADRYDVVAELAER